MIKKTQHCIDAHLIRSLKTDISAFDGKTAINKPTGDFFYDPWTIQDQYRGSIWQDILFSLPVSQGEARLICLQPGQSYMAHADIDDRYHLNISGNNSFLIDIESQTMYKTELDGIWYEMNAGRIHAATNYGSIPRLQLVVRKLLINPILVDTVKIKILPNCQKHDYRYQFDNLISPWLNAKNKQEKLRNFRYNDNIVEFELIRDSLDELMQMNKGEFNITYE